uniref:Peptidase A1 domain-containing protein n=1 Tax=Oryza glaberrima TaxID=4538 RepID=I1PYH4_ORYGL
RFKAERLYLVTMDTGSSLSWVQCRPCTIKCHVQPAKVGPIFDPSNSSTFRHVGCSTSICSYLGRTLRIQSKGCMEREDICLYTMSYGGGWAYSVGKVVTDRLVLGGGETTRTTLSLANFVFGCSMDTQYSTHKEAGIFGLGTSNYSFEQIAPLLSYKAFSYCLPSDEAHQGYLSIGPDSSGGVPTSMFPGTPRPVYSIGMTGLTVTVNGEVRSLVSGSGSSPSPSSLMVVDSGAKLTLLLASTFGQLEDAIIPAMESLGYSLNTAAGQNQLCFLTESDRQNYLQRKPPPPSNWSALPVFHISFTLGLTLTLPPKNAFYLDDILGLCSSFARDDYLESGYQILGNLVTKSYGITYDIPRKQFRFRTGEC